jgi:hypothetical protein
MLVSTHKYTLCHDSDDQNEDIWQVFQHPRYAGYADHIVVFSLKARIVDLRHSLSYVQQYVPQTLLTLQELWSRNSQPLPGSVP